MFSSDTFKRRIAQGLRIDAYSRNAIIPEHLKFLLRDRVRTPGLNTYFLYFGQFRMGEHALYKLLEKHFRKYSRRTSSDIERFDLISDLRKDQIHLPKDRIDIRGQHVTLLRCLLRDERTVRAAARAERDPDIDVKRIRRRSIQHKIFSFLRKESKMCLILPDTVVLNQIVL